MRVWDLRSPGCQREYGSRAAVNTVVLHPNQGELISGKIVYMFGLKTSCTSAVDVCMRKRAGKVLFCCA